VCGADVPPRSASCPECGADERTGWNDEATRYDGVDLPESAFDDESSTRSSRSDARPRRDGPHGVHPLWLWVGAGLLLALIGRVLGLY
jgi:hypothetical protein